MLQEVQYENRPFGRFPFCKFGDQNCPRCDPTYVFGPLSSTLRIEPRRQENPSAQPYLTSLVAKIVHKACTEHVGV